MDFGLVAGYANHRALALLVEDGWRPVDVLRMPTSGGATLLGIGDETGRIGAGLAADFVIVDRHPLDDIRDVEKVRWVIEDGVVYDPEKLRASVKRLVGWQ